MSEYVIREVSQPALGKTAAWPLGVSEISHHSPAVPLNPPSTGWLLSFPTHLIVVISGNSTFGISFLKT